MDRGRRPTPKTGTVAKFGVDTASTDVRLPPNVYIPYSGRVFRLATPPRVDALPKPTAAGREFRRGRAGAAQSFPRRQGQPLDRPRRASPRRRSSDVHLQRASKNSGTEKGLLQPAAFSRTTSRDAALMRVRQTGLGAGSERQSALESTPYKPRTASRRQGYATMLSQAGCRPKPEARPALLHLYRLW